MMPLVSEQDFNREVLTSSQPVLVHFWAPWCGLCRMLEPILHKCQTELDQSIKIVGINADENFRLANTYRLKNLPTILLFEGGSLRQRLDDFKSRDSIYQALERIMTNSLAKSA